MKFRPSRKKKENKKHVFPSQSVFFRMIKNKSFFFFKKAIKLAKLIQRIRVGQVVKTHLQYFFLSLILLIILMFSHLQMGFGLRKYSCLT